MKTYPQLSAKLNPGRLFHLAFLCEGHDEMVRDRTPITDDNIDEAVQTHLAVEAPIVKLLHEAGVTFHDFGDSGYDDFHPAFMLAAIAMSPDDYPPGSAGYELALAAGIRSA